MSASGSPNAAKNAILGFLLMHSPSNIDKIQAMLKRRFSEVYGKNSNLTMIHRHLKDLKKIGFVVAESQYETMYSISEEFRDYFSWLLGFHKGCNLRLPDQLYDFTEKFNPYWHIYQFFRIEPEKFVQLYEYAFGISKYVHDPSIPMDLYREFFEYYVEPIRKYQETHKEKIEKERAEFKQWIEKEISGNSNHSVIKAAS